MLSNIRAYIAKYTVAIGLLCLDGRYCVSQEKQERLLEGAVEVDVEFYSVTKITGIAQAEKSLLKG